MPAVACRVISALLLAVTASWSLAQGWPLGVFFPTGASKDIIARLNAAVVKALADPKIRERDVQSGLEPVGNTPERFAAVVRADYEKYGRLVRELNITVD